MADVLMNLKQKVLGVDDDSRYLKIMGVTLEGVCDFIAKPFVPEELEAKVKVYLHLAQTEQYHSAAFRDVDLIANELVQVQSAQTHSTQLAAIGEMTSGIVHEVNNPLTVISYIARKGIRDIDLGNLDPVDFKKMLQKIESTIERISGIVRGIKFLARNGAGDPFEKASLNKIIEEVFQIYKAGSKDDAVTVQVSPINGELVFECRATQIYQVILNLLNNANDAVSLLSERWVRLDVVDGGSEIEIKVTDSGPGIQKEIRDKLFSPFFTTKPSGKGTGLGLSIVSKMIQSHHGSIWVDPSSPNTCFIVKLPKTRIT